MSTYQNEIDFFHKISPEVIKIIAAGLPGNVMAVRKTSDIDIATQIDLDVEKAIVVALGSIFPTDSVLAEENYADTAITNERIWVIDPICGTNNLSRNIPSYCTNIALIDGGHIVASSVIDSARGEYYWATIDTALHRRQAALQESSNMPGALIDVDLGAAWKCNPAERRAYLHRIEPLLNSSDIMLTSINTSITLLYVALGRLDAVVNIRTNPWDQCAGIFLAQKVGCVVSELSGAAWTPRSSNYILARDEQLHSRLLRVLNG